MSYAELWSSMGLFAKGIVVMLFIMSVYSLGIAAAKWWRLRKSMRQTAKFAPEFARFLQEGQLDQAIALAEKQKVSHVARVLGEALVEVKPLLRDRATVSAGDINSSERAVERQMLIVHGCRRLSRSLPKLGRSRTMCSPVWSGSKAARRLTLPRSASSATAKGD